METISCGEHCSALRSRAFKVCWQTAIADNVLRENNLPVFIVKNQFFPDEILFYLFQLLTKWLLIKFLLKSDEISHLSYTSPNLPILHDEMIGFFQKFVRKCCQIFLLLFKANTEMWHFLKENDTLLIMEELQHLLLISSELFVHILNFLAHNSDQHFRHRS